MSWYIGYVFRNFKSYEEKMEKFNREIVGYFIYNKEI